MRATAAQLATNLARLTLAVVIVGLLIPKFRIVAKGGERDYPWQWCGDMNGDLQTDIYDFLLLLEQWYLTPEPVERLLEIVMNWQQDARGWWVIFDGTEPPHAVELEAP